MLQAKDRVWVFALVGLTTAYEALKETGFPGLSKTENSLLEVETLLVEHIKLREELAPLFLVEGSGRKVEAALKVATELVGVLLAGTSQDDLPRIPGTLLAPKWI